MILNLKVEVDFIYCPVCGTGPKHLNEKEVETFLLKHQTHMNPLLTKYVKIVGDIKRPKAFRKQRVSIRFVSPELKDKHNKTKRGESNGRAFSRYSYLV